MVEQPHEVLQKARQAFETGDFSAALWLYGEILADFPRLIEAKVGVMLSDLAMHKADEAGALFDFYDAVRAHVDEKNALQAVEEAMSRLSESYDAPMLSYESIAAEGDGIRYGDLLALAKERGSFKEAFEDILFSTKIILTSKEEFVDLVRHLLDAGMQETALKYLDASGMLFGNDQEVLALYGMVKGTQR